MQGLYDWRTTEQFFKTKFDLALSDQMSDERLWLYRFFEANEWPSNVSRVRFGRDNPKTGESKEPDFVVELEELNGKKLMGIELVSAYSVDTDKKTSVDPFSTLYQRENEWEATPDQRASAFRVAVESKFKKRYSKDLLDSLVLVICDETNSKESLFHGHRYIQGRCYFLRYEDGREFSRATSIQHSADGVVKSATAQFDSVYALTRMMDKDVWIALNLLLRAEREKLQPLLCPIHPYETVKSSFGRIPFNGVKFDSVPSDYSREAAYLHLKAYDQGVTLVHLNGK